MPRRWLTVIASYFRQRTRTSAADYFSTITQCSLPFNYSTVFQSSLPHTPCSITAPSLFALFLTLLQLGGTNQTGESCKIALSFLACLCQKGVFRAPSGVAISDVTFCPGRASTLGFFSFLFFTLPFLFPPFPSPHSCFGQDRPSALCDQNRYQT